MFHFMPTSSLNLHFDEITGTPDRLVQNNFKNYSMPMFYNVQIVQTGILKCIGNIIQQFSHKLNWSKHVFRKQLSSYFVYKAVWQLCSSR